MGSPRMSGKSNFRVCESDIEKIAEISGLPELTKLVGLHHTLGATRSVAGPDPVTYQVGTREDLNLWIKHFDSVGWPHSSLITTYTGHVLEFETPDGTDICFYTKPIGRLNLDV